MTYKQTNFNNKNFDKANHEAKPKSQKYKSFTRKQRGTLWNSGLANDSLEFGTFYHSSERLKCRHSTDEHSARELTKTDLSRGSIPQLCSALGSESSFSVLGIQNFHIVLRSVALSHKILREWHIFLCFQELSELFPSHFASNKEKFCYMTNVISHTRTSR